MQTHSHASSRRLSHYGVALAAGLLCWVGTAGADTTPTDPIDIAVFPFELEDFSAAQEQGSSPDVSPFLTQATEEAKKQLAASGRYTIVEASAADLSASGRDLRNCNGCETQAAGKVGADQTLVGVVTKISMAEYVVRILVRDTRTGEATAGYTTGLRMGTGDSWPRGVRWLMKNRMLAAK